MYLWIARVLEGRTRAADEGSEALLQRDGVGCNFTALAGTGGFARGVRKALEMGEMALCCGAK
jgi:hypothetical protein